MNNVNSIGKGYLLKIILYIFSYFIKYLIDVFLEFSNKIEKSYAFGLSLCLSTFNLRKYIEIFMKFKKFI